VKPAVCPADCDRRGPDYLSLVCRESPALEPKGTYATVPGMLR